MPTSVCPVYSRAAAPIFPRERVRAINRRAIFIIRESFTYGHASGMNRAPIIAASANEQRRGGTRAPTDIDVVADLETRISINALYDRTHNFEQSRLIEARCLVNVSFGKRDRTRY